MEEKQESNISITGWWAAVIVAYSVYGMICCLENFADFLIKLAEIIFLR